MPMEILLVSATVTVIGLIVAISTGVFKVGTWVGGINQHKSEVTGFMREIRDKITEIFDRLPGDTTTAASPLSLNALGQKISAELKVGEWAAAISPALAPEVADKSAFDIRQFCFDFMRNDFDPDAELQAAIKDCAFQHGASISGVRDVFAIELRDVLLGGQDPPERGPRRD